MRNMSLTLMLISIIFGSLKIEARESKIDDMESVLDRLERKLLQHERSTSSFLLNDGETSPRSDKTPIDYDGEEVEINGDLPENDELRTLARTLNDIESEVDHLVGDIQRTTQKVIEHAKVDNHIDIETEIKDPKNLIVRHLNVYLDNYEIYRLDLSRSVHVPMTAYPIFSGPLEPGTHRLKISMKFTEIIEDKLPLKQGAFGSAENEFELEIPPGQFRKKWGINLVKEANGEKYTLQLK